MEEPIRARVLCVDDEPQVLASLSLHLRRHYEVQTATSGAQGVALLRGQPGFAVVMSDMRMPGMDGAAFLREARILAPDAPRLLLTGHADIDSAIAAVNDGQIFRFLVKPCPPPAMIAAFEAAVAQHRLITAERVLLEQTLKGVVKTLSDVLAITHPAAFGQATGAKQLAGEVAALLAPAERWAVEVAAMLAPLGFIALPGDVAEKLANQRPLDADEKAMVDRVPALTTRLLSNIPRLEPVRGILTMMDTGTAPFLSPTQQVIAKRCAAILRAVLDFDQLEAHGEAGGRAIAALQARHGRYDAAVVKALDALRGRDGTARPVREIPVGALRAGMVIAGDVRLASGVLLAARGFEVSEGLVERIQNLRPGAVQGPVRVYSDPLVS